MTGESTHSLVLYCIYRVNWKGYTFSPNYVKSKITSLGGIPYREASSLLIIKNSIWSLLVIAVITDSSFIALLNCI